MSKKEKTQRGITLIALVVTIIIILILSVVTITIMKNSGLIGYARKATGETKNKMDTEQQVMEIMKPKEKKIISTTDSYVGCYADFDCNGIPEGIIYADLAHTVSGAWNNNSWNNYEYIAENGFKSYYILEENYTEGVFDNNDENEKIAMIAPVERTTGKDRFYVMALEDIKSSYWYRRVTSRLFRSVGALSNDFGEGKNNTIVILNGWNNKTYGEQQSGDLWGVIQQNKIKEKYPLVTNINDSQKWFVPSKSEWAAYGDCLYTKLGVTNENYGDYGFSSDSYWTSSQYRNMRSLLHFP